MSGTESTRPALLCDADGCLFPSEDPAYDASAIVTAGFLTEMGIDDRLSADQLRREFTGLNFRATALELCRRRGVQVAAETLEHWVGVERDVVTRHLGQTLRPDRSVEEPLRELSQSLQLAMVSSSALPRLDVCLAATGLSRLFWTSHRYSAEDLRPPRSKPAPDVYVAALQGLRLPPSKTLAVEDSAVGVRAAVAAGIPVVGLVQFVPEAEERRSELLSAGAMDVLDSWHEVAGVARAHLLSSGLPSSGATSRRMESEGGSPSSAASRRR